MEQQPIHFFRKTERGYEKEPLLHETGPEDTISPEIWISSALIEKPVERHKEITMNHELPIETLVRNGRFETATNPKLVIAVLEPKCNLKCLHCYWNHDIDYGKRTPEWDQQITQIIDWDADVAYAGRVLTPRAARFIKEYCERSKKRIGVVDNGYTILTRPELFTYYDYVNISLDGVPEDHDHQRNQRGSSDVAWHAINELKRVSEEQENERLYPIVSATFSPFNIDRWNHFEAMLIENGLPMSCNPVLGVQENYDRNMPLFDENGIQKAFDKIINGMPKIINLYDPRHVKALMPLLRNFQWNIRPGGDALRAKLENETVLIYKPLSVQTFGERTLLWTGNFHADADVADANFTEIATTQHLLSVANRFAEQERPLAQELLGQ